MAIDYDPAAAHEYYINYRKKGLKKGRKKRSTTPPKNNRSTKGFSQTKKEQWAYAKHQLAEEHKEIGNKITNDSKLQRYELSENAKIRRTQVSNLCKEQISELREKVKNAPKALKASMREQVNQMIDNLRGNMQLQKERISADLKANREQITEETKDARISEKVAYEKRKDQAYKTIKKGKK